MPAGDLYAADTSELAAAQAEPTIVDLTHPHPPRVGVVIPCKNEAMSLRSCLHALREQVPAPDRIVVVDNGSTDGSLQIAQQLADVVLPITTGTISQLRNAGAAEVADLDVVAFVDADVVVETGWLAAALTGLREAHLVGARSAAPTRGTWVERRWAALEATTTGDNGATRVWSQHLALTTHTFNHLGGFRTDLATGEDSDLSDRVHDAGKKVQLVPGMHAIHHGFPRTLPAMWRRERWHTHTPGFWSRMSSHSRRVIALAGGWCLVGAITVVASMATSTITTGLACTALWIAMTLLMLPFLGYAVGKSVRYAVADGALLGLWLAARVRHLPRELWRNRLSGSGRHQ